jgi:hydrogenase maturation protease
MSQVLVIAYGNPLRGDDGIAWHVAQALIELQLEQLEVLIRHQLTPELAEALSSLPRVVFIDASVQLSAGQVERRDLEPEVTSEVLTHHLEPAQLLGLTKTLYGQVPHASLISIGVQNLDYGEQLSPQLRTALPKILEMVCLELSTEKKYLE